MKRKLILEVERFDKEMVGARVKEVEKKIEELGKDIASKMYETGRIVNDATQGMTRREMTYCYDLIHERLGYGRKYMQQAKTFFRRYPNFEELLQKGLKVNMLVFMSYLHYDKFGSIVRTICENPSVVKDMTFREFRCWLREEFKVKGRFVPIHKCAICGEDIPMDIFISEGESGCWHKQCLDDLKTSRKPELDEIEHKEAILNKHKEILRMWKEKLTREQEAYDGLVDLLKVQNEVLSTIPDAEKKVWEKLKAM